MNSITPAAIYARYSSDMQDDMSISSQVNECTAWAEKNGYKVVAIYSDEAASGTIARDGLDDLKNAVNSPDCPFKAVIAWKASRIARDVELATGFRGYLRRRNIKLLFAADPNLDGPMSVIVDSILDGFNAFFIEDLAANVLRGQKQWASLGYTPPGAPPYGYRKVPVESSSNRQKYKYAPIPEEAAILRRIFEDYANGIPLTKIALKLKGEGIRTQNGTLWTCGKLWKLMFGPQRDTYLGTIVYNKYGRAKPEPDSKRPRRNQVKYLKPESEWVVCENAHEPIITREMFDRVDSIRTGLTERVELIERLRGGKRLMLSGLIRCYYCNLAYVKESGNKKGVNYYGCISQRPGSNPRLDEKCDSHLLRAPELHEFVIGGLKKRIANVGKIKQTGKRSATAKGLNQSAVSGELARLQKQRLDIMRKRSNLIDVIADGLLTREEVDPKLSALSVALEALDIEIRKAEAKQKADTISEALAETIDQIPEGWEHDEETARKVALALIDRIIAKDLEVTVYYRLPGPPDVFVVPVKRRRSSEIER